MALKCGKHSVMDTAWGIGIALTALVSLLATVSEGQPARRYLLLAAWAAWGLRLAAYLSWRNHGREEDPRYRDLLSRAERNRNLYALRTVYLLQGAILWVACLPVQAGMLERAPAGPVTVIGVGLWLGGFAFESAGDWQLARFKADPGNRGLIMDRGLWRYTRHPNYFDDFCMWWGLFLIALGSWAELPTVIAPLLMTFILTRGTGQRLTDRRMAATRPQYADYAARTSGFIPLPPRRHLLPNGTWSHLRASAPARRRAARRRIGGRPPPRDFYVTRRLRPEKSQNRVMRRHGLSPSEGGCGPCGGTILAADAGDRRERRFRRDRRSLARVVERHTHPAGDHRFRAGGRPRGLPRFRGPGGTCGGISTMTARCGARSRYPSSWTSPCSGWRSSRPGIRR